MHKTPIECDFRGSHKWNGIPVPSTTIYLRRNTSLDEREFVQHCVTANTSSNQITSSHRRSTLNKSIYTHGAELKKWFEFYLCRSLSLYRSPCRRLLGCVWQIPSHCLTKCPRPNRIWANAKGTKPNSGPWPFCCCFCRMCGEKRVQMKLEYGKTKKFDGNGFTWEIFECYTMRGMLSPRCVHV